MNKYRSHNCSELTEKDDGKVVSLSGWLHRKRDHGNLLFIDLRDHYGLTQCVIENNSKLPWSLFLCNQPDKDISLPTSFSDNSEQLCVLYLFIG